MNIKPSPGFVLVKQEKIETKTVSGLILQESSLEKPQQGVVLACGSQENCPAKVGDTIIFKKWGSNDIKFNNEEYQIIKFEDILATIEENKQQAQSN